MMDGYKMTKMFTDMIVIAVCCGLYLWILYG